MSTTKSMFVANHGLCKKGFPFHFAASEWQDSSPNKTKQKKRGPLQLHHASIPITSHTIKVMLCYN